MQDETTLGRRSQEAGIKILIEKGFIKTALKGSPAKKHFSILEENVFRLFTENGFSDSPKRTNKIVQNEQTSLSKTSKLVCTKRTNKIVQNEQTLYNNIDTIIKKDIKESDTTTHTPVNNVPNFVKEEQKKIVPHVVKIVPKIEEVEQEMKSSATLKESVMKINKITEKQHCDFLEEFFNHTRGYEKEVLSISDHKRHYLSWVKTQVSIKTNGQYAPKQYAPKKDLIHQRIQEADDYGDFK
jgi:hypothetical protein